MVRDEVVKYLEDSNIGGDEDFSFDEKVDFICEIIGLEGVRSLREYGEFVDEVIEDCLMDIYDGCIGEE